MIDPKTHVAMCEAEFAAGRASRDVAIAELHQQLAAAQEDAIEQARIVGMGGEREIDLRKQVTLLRDALGCVVRHGELSDSDCDKYQLYCEVPRAAIKAGRKTLSATELITNYGDGSTRRRNADDMGNPPTNAAELLNAWKPKP